MWSERRTGRGLALVVMLLALGGCGSVPMAGTLGGPPVVTASPSQGICGNMSTSGPKAGHNVWLSEDQVISITPVLDEHCDRIIFNLSGSEVPGYEARYLPPDSESETVLEVVVFSPVGVEVPTVLTPIEGAAIQSIVYAPVSFGSRSAYRVTTNGELLFSVTGWKDEGGERHLALNVAHPN